MLRIFAKELLLADQIAVNHLHTPISDKPKAMLAFALKLSRTPKQICTEDYGVLK
jgi:hypothetical protein